MGNSTFQTLPRSDTRNRDLENRWAKSLKAFMGRPARWLTPVALLVSATRAQAVTDADWVGMGGFPGANQAVRAVVVDGLGNWYVAGDFSVVGDVAASRIAKWDGAGWASLSSGINGSINALAISGGDLYVGGSFTRAGGLLATNIAKWNGTNWSALGAGITNPVLALGFSGPTDLYVGGTFTNAGGVPANRVAKWDGTIWSALGSGMNGAVRALAVSGADLYAGGDFMKADGNTATCVAKWSGGGWLPLALGLNNPVRALVVSGTNLYAGGDFTASGPTNAMRRVAKGRGRSMVLECFLRLRLRLL